MARKKIVVERKPMKVKRTRKITEEQREALRQRMIEMRKKRKPAEYKNVSKKVLALPEDDRYSFKNVKEWIKETKDQISALNKQARGRNVLPQDRQKASNLADSKKHMFDTVNIISKQVIGSECFLENMRNIE